MEESLAAAARIVAQLADAIAILVMAIGVLSALIAIVRLIFRGRVSHYEKRAAWLDFAGWLVAGLTFQLAADILETTLAPTWDQIGRVAAIAAIRTFLTFFLDRDMDVIRELQHTGTGSGGDAGTE
jgi:uncharacterized membrane protein